MQKQLWRLVLIYILCKKLCELCGKINEYENQLMDDFCSMYIRHISDEETKIYPISFHSLTMDDLLVMSKDMMVRRGVQ